MSCIVEFCRKNCPLLPDDVEVFRASGRVVCQQCGFYLREHVMFAYPSGAGHAVRGCDGKFYHL